MLQWAESDHNEPSRRQLSTPATRSGSVFTWTRVGSIARRNAADLRDAAPGAVEPFVGRDGRGVSDLRWADGLATASFAARVDHCLLAFSLWLVRQLVGRAARRHLRHWFD